MKSHKSKPENLVTHLPHVCPPRVGGAHVDDAVEIDVPPLPLGADVAAGRPPPPARPWNKG